MRGAARWLNSAVLRPDREDTTAQAERVLVARAALRDALDGVVEQCRGHADLAGVTGEARDLARALTSRAKRPPPVAAAPFFGQVSAAHRTAVRPDEFDAAVRRVRDAEAELDLALYDLTTARGDDG